MKTTKEKLSRWLGPEQWLLRIGLAVAGAAALATYGVLAGWRDGLSSLLTSKLSPQLLLDTVWLLLLGLLLMVLSWWFYYRSVQFKSSVLLGRVPRKLRGDVLRVLREVERLGDDDDKLPGVTGLTEQMVRYAMNELRHCGLVQTQLAEWGTPSVWHVATPAGRKVVVENFGTTPKE